MLNAYSTEGVLGEVKGVENLELATFGVDG